MERKVNSNAESGLFLVLVSILVLLSITFANTGNTASATTGVLVPLYEKPGSSWDTVIQAKNAHPAVPIIAIINPASGPGSSQDPKFVMGIQKLQASGVTVIGYVDTAFTARSSSEVKADIDKYKSLYPSINGIFFDQMFHFAGRENYYSELSQYAKSQGFTFTVGNPGTDTLPSYVGTVDNIVIYEGAGLPSIEFLGGWHANFDKSNFSFISYGVSSLDQTFLNSASNSVGYVYITNDILPNPYDTAPPYFGNLVEVLEPLTIIAPLNVTVNTDPAACSTDGVSLGTPTTSGGIAPVSITNDAPSTFPLGTTTVTWTAADSASPPNTSTSTQTVTVNDLQQPIIAAPPNIVVTANTAGGATGVNLGTPTVSDNCLGVTFTNNAPSTFPLGITTVTWTATDASGNLATAIQLLTVKPLPVKIDIKPRSESNSINCVEQKRIVTLAILSTQEFDVTKVDPLSVKFGSSGATEVHSKGHIEDIDKDGDIDMVLHFRFADTGIKCGDTEATLTGETLEGIPISGTDAIRTVGKEERQTHLCWHRV